MRDYQFKLPTAAPSARVKTALDPAHLGVVGVAINGVPIVYEHPEEGSDMTMLFDSCGGHGDVDNRYHYHIPPVCLLRMLGGAVPRRSDWWLAPHPESQWPSTAPASLEASPLVGWALDGHPIFGPYNPDTGDLVVAGGGGSEACGAKVLDECNGMELANGVYAYFLSPTFPFVPPCLMGPVAADAFVDNGLKANQVQQCPFEGTQPLKGKQACAEAPIVFSDTTCPGQEDRQAIRQCFDSAVFFMDGEPSCAELEAVLPAARACFDDRGCSPDWDATAAYWRSTHLPALDSCAWPAAVEFADDSTLEVVFRLAMSEADFTPEKQTVLRQTVAAEAGVKTSNVRITSIVEVTVRRATTALDVTTQIAAADAAAAASLQASLSGGDTLANALESKLGVDVSVSTEPVIVEMTVAESIAAASMRQWSLGGMAGAAWGCIGVLLLGGAM